jgi:hypothetical protein
MDVPPKGIEKLLESPIHEVRVGGVSIMDWQARSKKTPEARRKELFDLYISRHDRINNWDLVDRSAPYVVGGTCSIKIAPLLENIPCIATGFQIRSTQVRGSVISSFTV